MDVYQIKKYLAESIGTFMLVFIGTGAIIVNTISGGALGHLGVAVAFGTIILVMVYACGHISGAHFNPAVTIAFWVAGRMDRTEVVPYIICQVAGAISGSAVLLILFGKVSNLGATLPNSMISNAVWFAVSVEFIFTGLLMFVIMSVVTDIKAERSSAGLVIGLTVMVGAVVAGPVTGGSFNPARSIGPAIMIGNFTDLWIYLIGPIAGAIAGATAYQHVSTTAHSLGQVASTKVDD